ncbi:MAG: serine/threonine-protein kinase, partial [Pseudomonadota bacterium]
PSSIVGRSWDIEGVIGLGFLRILPVATNADVGDDGENVAKKMFINEARSAGRLDHQNILKVYEAGEEDGQPYMVMEFIDGGETLRSFCSQEQLLSVAEVVRLIRQSADALDYAHQQGVLHRDVKPANIMLTNAGVAKLGDFGIARRMGVDQTQIVGWFGSPLYMSPEQAEDKELTSQSDLFSLGSVFYEMLCGTPPFAAKGLSSLIQKVCSEDPQPIHEVNPEVPEVLWRVIKRMLAKDVADRYATGAEIVRDLDDALDQLERALIQLTDEQKLEKLKELVFFSEFSKAEIKEVSKVADWRSYSANEAVFSEGDQEQSFFVVAEGSVAISINGTRIRDLETGECFGEMEYLTSAGRTATVTTNRETVLVKIDKDFREWASLPSQVRLNRAFQNVLVERLRTTSKALARALGG